MSNQTKTHSEMEGVIDYKLQIAVYINRDQCTCTSAKDADAIAMRNLYIPL